MKLVMDGKKSLDQLWLLATAVVFIVGVLCLIDFMEKVGVHERVEFYILANVIVCFILTWIGAAWFRRAQRFWFFHAGWIVLHAIVAVAWAFSGRWVELCVFVLPLEAYVYAKVAKYRLQREPSL